MGRKRKKKITSSIKLVRRKSLYSLGIQLTEPLLREIFKNENIQTDIKTATSKNFGN